MLRFNILVLKLLVSLTMFLILKKWGAKPLKNNETGEQCWNLSSKTKYAQAYSSAVPG